MSQQVVSVVLLPSIPTFDYLPWYQSLTTASGRRLIASVVRVLDSYPDKLGSIPTTDGIYFQLCFIPLLRLSCR